MKPPQAKPLNETTAHARHVTTKSPTLMDFSAQLELQTISANQSERNLDRRRHLLGSAFLSTQMSAQKADPKEHD